MKNLLYIAGAALLVMGACRHDTRVAHNFNEKTNVDANSLTFIKNAAESNNAEVKISTLAEAHSKNPRVIGFAKMMIKDHSDADKELKTLAFKKYVTLGDSPNLDHIKLKDSLSKINAPGDFDKVYMKAMVADHEKAVQSFHQESESNNLGVKNYAEKYLPIMRMHLDSARKIYSSLK